MNGREEYITTEITQSRGGRIRRRPRERREAPGVQEELGIPILGRGVHFPNFNMSLKDPHLCDALKVQVQITGASRVQDTFAATLHYQLAYRLQNHAFDMAVPDIAQSNDALLIQVDLRMTPMCTFVPRQLDKDQMMSLFPESWITKYEMLHQATKPIQSKNPLFIRKENGEVETKFLMAPSEKKDVTVFPT